MKLINAIQQLHSEQVRLKNLLGGLHDSWLITYHDNHDTPRFTVHNYDYKNKNGRTKAVTFEVSDELITIVYQQNITDDEIIIAKELLVNTLNTETVPCQF